MKKEELIEKLFLKRRKLGLSQKEIGQEIGVTPMAISYYERGRRNPDFDVLQKWCEYLGFELKLIEIC